MRNNEESILFMWRRSSQAQSPVRCCNRAWSSASRSACLILLAQHSGHVHHSTRRMVIGFPLVGLGAVTEQLTVGCRFGVPAAVDGIEQMLFDEVPLFQEGVP